MPFTNMIYNVLSPKMIDWYYMYCGAYFSFFLNNFYHVSEALRDHCTAKQDLSSFKNLQRKLSYGHLNPYKKSNSMNDHI